MSGENYDFPVSFITRLLLTHPNTHQRRLLDFHLCLCLTAMVTHKNQRKSCSSLPQQEMQYISSINNEAELNYLVSNSISSKAIYILYQQDLLYLTAEGK